MQRGHSLAARSLHLPGNCCPCASHDLIAGLSAIDCSPFSNPLGGGRLSCSCPETLCTRWQHPSRPRFLLCPALPFSECHDPDSASCLTTSWHRFLSSAAGTSGVSSPALNYSSLAVALRLTSGSAVSRKAQHFASSPARHLASHHIGSKTFCCVRAPSELSSTVTRT